MTTPGPDEKLCPFCAETIKAAAIKCRYCRSDLPVAAIVREQLVPVAAVPATAPPARPVLADEPLPTHSSPTPRLNTILVGLVVACLLLAGGSIWLLVDGDSDKGAAQRPAAVGEIVVGKTSESASPGLRAAALSAASSNAVTVLSYSYKTLGHDEQEARAVVTAEFLKEYEAVMAEAAPKAKAARITLAAKVVATSLVSVDVHRAVALLFVNAVSTSEDSPKEQVSEKRVLLTMTRKDGSWIVSKIDAF